MGKFYTETLQKGSQGDSVKEWQNFLKSQGYNLNIDGIFGDETHYYTKRYQQKNKLTTDGIVGANTWGAAGYSNISTPISAPTISAAPTAPTFNNTNFGDTDEGKSAFKTKTDAENAVKNYGDFTFSKEEDWKTIYDKYYNRDPFQYDFNADALYQQYKDKYIQQGKLAMQDTMGQAAAMTGGYGNSYAQMAGQQAYQSSLDNLNDIIPELYQMAYDRYKNEGQEMLNKLGLLDNERTFEYGQWGDGYNRLVDDRNYANSDYYNQESSYNTNRDTANGLLQKDYDNKYGEWQDETANAQWQAEYDEGVRQFAEQMAFQKQQHADSKKSTSTTNNTTKVEDDKPKESASNYADWDAGDWEAYFAYIRQNEGQAAASQELSRMTKAGYIPKNMVTYAAIGARGGAQGH